MIRYRLFLLLDTVLMALPKSWRKGLFTTLAALARHLAPKRNRVIQQNLSFAFGDSLSSSQREGIERYCYRNLALNFLQVMENRRNSADELAKRVTFENREYVDHILSTGKGTIFVSAHFGNWELGAAALSSLVTPTTAIYKGFDRPEFDPYLLEARSRHRMEMAEKSGALKYLTRTLKNGGCVSLMIDQASNARHGVAVDFFGHKTYHSSTPATLSFKYEAPIIPLYIFTSDEKHYTIRFGEPIKVNGDDTASIREATQKQVDTLERAIRERPELWFWCHKRWKGEFPEIYRKE